MTRCDPYRSPSVYALPTENDQLRNVDVLLRKGFAVDLLSAIQESDVGDKRPSNLRENAGEHPSTGAALLLHADSGGIAYTLLSPTLRDEFDEQEAAALGFWGESILLNPGKYILVSADSETGLESMMPLFEVEVDASGRPKVRLTESPEKYDRILDRFRD
jgi:hypothetical protein